MLNCYSPQWTEEYQETTPAKLDPGSPALETRATRVYQPPGSEAVEICGTAGVTGSSLQAPPRRQETATGRCCANRSADRILVGHVVGGRR